VVSGIIKSKAILFSQPTCEIAGQKNWKFQGKNGMMRLILCSRMNRQTSLPRFGNPALPGGFTLLELLVVVAIIGILAGLLLPVLAACKAKARGVSCQNNNQQLASAWLMYADDNAQRLAYNLAGAAARTNLNWAAGVLDWELSADNTNVANLTEAALGSYVSKVPAIYRCPSDSVVSALQSAAGWSSRVRSYSMNASVGDAGALTSSGVNTNNPNYSQFFTLTSIPAPAQIFVFLDEHPDSISDGYFVNRTAYPEWIRLPASWHNGGATFSYADGHAETHRWKSASTMPPSRPDAAGLPIDASNAPLDLNWILAHMSVSLGPPPPYSASPSYPTNSY
jgi:prepilin-type N-terminal cleavage/methylation domain-containing protein/prepilin-type processing-associated H-X9-DG protein